MAFNLAQTFYVNKSAVSDSDTVTITSIDLYFKSKPRQSSNRSGIESPGVNIVLLETTENDLPNVSRPVMNAVARREYDSIIVSTDASSVSTFNFTKPVVVKTNKSYALAVSYDGDEDYDLWMCKEGEKVVGTNTTCTGATAPGVGKYYDYIGTSNDDWKPLTNVDLKFTINVAKYAENNGSFSATYLLPSDPVEYIMYDRYNPDTLGRTSLKLGETVFQETPVSYGTIRVSSDSNVVTALNAGINFSNLVRAASFDESFTASDNPVVDQPSYIVLRHGTGSGANVSVRQVTKIVSNTQIEVDHPPSFSTNTATFSITAAGTLVYSGTHWYTGRWWNDSTEEMASLSNQRTDFVKIAETNANSTVRFVNNMVQDITIVSGGIGYSNSNVVTVYPVTNANTANANHINYIPSYANAVANVITNNAGTITGIGIRNAGHGLMSNVQYSIATTGGSGANLAIKVGSTIRGETSNASLSDCVVTNLEVHGEYPELNVKTDQSHNVKLYQHLPYYVTRGTEHIIRTSSPAKRREISVGDDNNLYNSDDGRIYVATSRSNDATLTGNVSIVVANGSIVDTLVRSPSIIELDIQSDNIFSLPLVETDSVYTYNYIVNNDATNEHKSAGSALCRHISKKVTFKENRFAEDIVVYVNAHRPSGTDIKVYAKLHNKADDEAFDDKDWTLLEVRSGNESVYSSLTDSDDLIEYTYGIPASPPSVNTISGSVTSTVSSAVVNGIATSFSSDLKVNDVVKIYSPLFPDNYMISTVSSIANNTQLTLQDSVTSSSVAGSGFKLDLIGRPSDGTDPEVGYPHQSFINPMNDKVVRYYNGQNAKFDTYNTFAIKIVLLSENSSIVAKIDNVSAVGVSA